MPLALGYHLNPIYIYIYIFLSNKNVIRTLKKIVTQVYMTYTTVGQYNQEHKLQASNKS